jgi:glycosyltransferase involved in cell wall biosynthesis
MAKPLISVLMINYNKENFLEEALDSYIKQTYKNRELIVVDDGSTDESKLILKKFENEYNHIKVYYKPHSGSKPKLWNFAHRMAKGKYIMNLDSDDVIFSDAIETLVSEAEKKSLDVCFGSMVHMDETGTPLQPHIFFGTSYEFGRLIKHMYLTPPRLYRRKLFEKTTGYNESLSLAQDWDLYLQMEEISTNFGWTGKRPLYCYRRYDKSSGNIANKDTYQAFRDAARENAIKRRNAKRILVVGRKWDEGYTISLRKEGHDVISFFEESPEVSYLDQYTWLKPRYQRRKYPVFKTWRRCLSILEKFKCDLIIIKEKLPFVLNLIIQYKTKDIPKKRLY